jgi:hypothetical protein
MTNGFEEAWEGWCKKTTGERRRNSLQEPWEGYLVHSARTVTGSLNVIFSTNGMTDGFLGPSKEGLSNNISMVTGVRDQRVGVGERF